MPEINYASKGVAGTGLGLGIAGTALGLLAGGLGNIFNVGGGGACTCHENTLINRYEATQQARIAELETEVKLRDANTFTMSEMGKLRDYFETKFSNVEKELCDQKVFNTATTAALNCTAGQVAQLMNLTKLVVPITSICPTPAVATTTTATAG
jgi:hypothetical protein